MQQGIGKRHICQLSSASEMTNLTTQGYHYQEGVLAGAVLKQQKTDRNIKKKFSFDVAFAYPASKRYRLSFSNVLIPNREFVLFCFWSILGAIHGCIDQMLSKKICTEKPSFFFSDLDQSSILYTFELILIIQVVTLCMSQSKKHNLMQMDGNLN